MDIDIFTFAPLSPTLFYTTTALFCPLTEALLLLHNKALVTNYPQTVAAAGRPPKSK